MQTHRLLKAPSGDTDALGRELGVGTSTGRSARSRRMCGNIA